MMRIFLYILAAILFIAPIVFIGYFSLLSCAYVTSSSANCGIDIGDFFDKEVLPFLAIMWAFALVVAYLGFRFGKKRANQLSDK